HEHDVLAPGRKAERFAGRVVPDASFALFPRGLLRVLVVSAVHRPHAPAAGPGTKHRVRAPVTVHARAAVRLVALGRPDGAAAVAHQEAKSQTRAPLDLARAARVGQ